MEQITDSTTESESLRKTPEELLAEGKRCLAAGDVANSVENLQEACALLSDQFGQLAKELAEPYYLYGKALLELARSESTVLGSGIPVPEDKASSSDEEEEEEGEEEGEGGEGGEAEAGGEEAEGVGEEKPSSTEDQQVTPEKMEEQRAPGSGRGGEEEEEEEEGLGVGSSGGQEEQGEGKGEGDGGVKGGEEEEESDLKLAWEVLELARVICQKEESDEYKLKLSDVHLALGEVALESDQLEQAVGDSNTGLQLRQLTLDPTDRRLAEAHFNLGLAYSLQKDMERSIQEYKSARDILSKRKDKLLKEMKDKPESEQKDMQDELYELDALLPELQSKISDAEEARESIDVEEESTTTIGFGQPSDEEAATITTRKAPAKDISHLVRKRPADTNSLESNQPKRLRTEELPAESTTPVESGENQELTSEQ